ncbi:DUF4232 domain-containing protein [Dactylosporangium sp. CA-233914]|uniref:DUF4232 domain-containing protein n=1 Tax=Dactylosporangium sp. CA-233914 TaxID=3239934 RepID=UPI003D8BD7E6
MTRRKLALTIAPFALVLTAAGCSGDAGDTSAARSTGPATAQAASAPPQSGGAGPSEDGGSRRCHSGEIGLSAQDAPGGGAAGSVYGWILLTNTSARTCTLFGYPGVSWVTGASGQPVNQPAERDRGTEPKLVTLQPRQAAHVLVHWGQPGNFPGCGPVQVAGYRVYLPDETAAGFVPWPVQECSADGVNRATVGPVVAGTSE